MSDSDPKRPACVPPAAYEAATAPLQAIARERGRAMFALLTPHIDDEVCQLIHSWRKELTAAQTFDVLIHSPGGDLTASYRAARLLATYTNSWDALVPRYAASGATLICLGSETIVLSDLAFLGPLDPQVISKHQAKFFMLERQSPLEAFQAGRYLQQFGLETLDATMQFLLENGVTPQQALEAATSLASQLVSPILGQIDPYDLGAFALDANLATDYCHRVCDPPDSYKKTQRAVSFADLVEHYPAHEFAIDHIEAEQLGLNVARASENLESLFDTLSEQLGKLHSYVGMVPETASVKINEAIAIKEGTEGNGTKNIKSVAPVPAAAA